MLGYGPGGEAFGTIMGELERLECPDEIGRIALFVAGLCTARDLRSWWSMRGHGDAGRKVFTINVDTDLLHSPLLIDALNRFLGPAAPICAEVNEDVGEDAVLRFKELAVIYGGSLVLALDDAHEMDALVRMGLESRIALAKVSNTKSGKMFHKLGENPSFVIRELANVRVPGKPTIVEGIETSIHLQFLKTNWDEATYGTLWVQGYFLSPCDKWQQVLVPVNKNTSSPEAFVVLEDPSAVVVEDPGPAQPAVIPGPVEQPGREPATPPGNAPPQAGSYNLTLRLSQPDLRLLTEVFEQLPAFATERERRAGVQRAVGGYPMGTRLLSQIDLSGSPGVAAHDVVTRMAGFELESGVDALIALVQALAIGAPAPERARLKDWLLANGVVVD
ncbi:MAG: hypothetical protein ACPGU7_01090 [Gammaproteobacteria bacterium]